jgi:hypothetical protein
MNTINWNAIEQQMRCTSNRDDSLWRISIVYSLTTGLNTNAEDVGKLPENELYDKFENGMGLPARIEKNPLTSPEI